MQQRVVQWLTAILCCFDEHLQILHNLLLAAEVTETQRSQSVLKVFFAVREPFLVDVKIFVHHICGDKVTNKREKIKRKSR